LPYYIPINAALASLVGMYILFFISIKYQ